MESPSTTPHFHDALIRVALSLGDEKLKSILSKYVEKIETSNNGLDFSRDAFLKVMGVDPKL